MLACVEKLLKEKKNCTLQARKLAVFGATGVVGYAAGVIAALEGAEVTLVGYDGLERVSNSSKEIKNRFNVDVRSADGSNESKKSSILANVEVALCAGRAGVKILSFAQLAAAKQLMIVADVNAVPPPGVEGLDMQANGDEITQHGTLGLGPLAIGNIKYKTEFGLFQKMISATKPTNFDFRGAFAFARELNA